MPPAASCLSAASVPCTRNGRSNCASVAWPVGAGVGPHAFLRMRPTIQSEPVSQPVDRGVIGVDEQIGEPAVVAAEGEGVSVEEHDARDLVWICEPGSGRYTRAE